MEDNDFDIEILNTRKRLFSQKFKITHDSYKLKTN